MKLIHLELADTGLFRDAIPMAAGVGSGYGSRWPLPSTLHEALRTALLESSGAGFSSKSVNGRDLSLRSHRELSRGITASPSKQKAARGLTRVASRAFQSLRVIGPFPWLTDKGVLFPMPLDAQFDESGAFHRLRLLHVSKEQVGGDPLPCLPMSMVPPNKQSPTGWWTRDQFNRYLNPTKTTGDNMLPLKESSLWKEEHHIGVQINPDSFAAKSGQLYSSTHLRPQSKMRLAALVGFGNRTDAPTSPSLSERIQRDEAQLGKLDRLLLGGEQRMAYVDWPPFNTCDLEPKLYHAQDDGPCLLKWALLTPAIFMHGWLPGWCRDTAGRRPDGEVCLPDLGGRARIVAMAFGRLVTVSGWGVMARPGSDDLVECPKPTRLAVPAGAVYYFLCENKAVANHLGAKLHWSARSDFFGEKGFGYGVCTPDVQMHPLTPDVALLANEVFGSTSAKPNYDP